MATGPFEYGMYGILRSTVEVYVVVQKLRWGDHKDLDDARDVLAVQGPETLDKEYIRRWCREHGTTKHLVATLDCIPPLERFELWCPVPQCRTSGSYGAGFIDKHFREFGQ